MGTMVTATAMRASTAARTVARPIIIRAGDNAGYGSLTSVLIRSASAGVAGLYITIPRSGRPSTAKAEYSSPISPATGCRTCLAASPYVVRTSLSRHIPSNSELSRHSSSTNVLTLLSVKPGGSARKIDVAGGLVTHGEGIPPLELHGDIECLR